jgi:integrase
MTAKIITNYLSDREQGVTGLRSPHIKFTSAALKNLPPAPVDYEIRDTERKGFICRVRKSGIKSLEIYKKPKGSPSPARITICALGELAWKSGNPHHTTVETEVDRILGELKRGINPNAKARAEQLKKDAESLTLAEARDLYINESSLKESTKVSYKAIVNNHFKDGLEGQLSALINKPLLTSAHNRITTEKGPVAANNAMRVLRAITNYTRGELEDEKGFSPIPIWPIKTKQQSKRFWNPEERRIGWIKPENLKAWWDATESLPEEYTGDGETARDYLQFVLLSGLRRREATQLRWPEIDFASKSFKILDTKNNKLLELPCSDHMMKILERRKKISNEGPFVIEEPKKFVAWVREKSGIYFTIHDMRRSFITYAESLDFGIYTIKALVNHSTGNSRDVTEGYLQLSVERLRKPMQSITNYIIGITKSGGVTSIREGGTKNG